MYHISKLVQYEICFDGFLLLLLVLYWNHASTAVRGRCYVIASGIKRYA